MVGAFNGAGYTTEEGNGNKAVSGLVYFRPTPMVPILKGLQFAYTGTYGKSNNKFTALGDITDNPDWRMNVVQASLQHAYFTVMGQYYWGKATRNSAHEAKNEGYLASAFMRIPSLEKMRVFAKYYHVDLYKGLASNIEHDTYVTGLSYDVTSEFMPFAAFERREYRTNLAAHLDYNKYQVGFQFRF
jgi:hypothetical protein